MHESPYPGELYVKGQDYNDGECNHKASLLVHCTSTNPESPWHNFASDTKHWRVTDDDDATICDSNLPGMTLDGVSGIWRSPKKRDLEVVGAPYVKGTLTL